MFRFISKHKVHESLIVAALVAASLTFHVAWILNLLVVRVQSVRLALILSNDIGPVSGMYTVALSVYFIVFFLTTLILKGRDCSHFRKSIFGFFLFSLFAFFVMTLPFIYSFSIAVE